MAEEKGDKEYCVYIHTVPKEISGYNWDKHYVGQTKKTLYQRSGKNGANYKKCPYFWKAIQKYGWNNIKHEIIASNLTLDEANNLEIETISKLHSNESAYGYNVTAGGGGSLGTSYPSKNKLDLTGQRYGRLICLAPYEEEDYKTKNKMTRWLCQCDCGNTKVVLTHSLRCGRSRSCGCLSKNKGRHPNYPNTYEDNENGMTINIKDRKILVDYDIYERVKNTTWYIDSRDNRIRGDFHDGNQRIRRHLLIYIIMGITENNKIINFRYINGNENDWRKENIMFVAPKKCPYEEYVESLKDGLKIYWNKDYYRWYIKYIPDGQAKQKSKSFATYKDAKSFLLELNTEVTNNDKARSN